MDTKQRQTRWAQDKEQRRQNWAQEHHLRQMRGALCLARLLGQRCSTPYLIGMDTGHPDRMGYPNRYHLHGLPDDDHVSLWSCQGRPAIYLSQPYHVTDQMRAFLEALVVIFPVLRYRISQEESWWYPGTTAIIVERVS